LPKGHEYFELNPKHAKEIVGEVAKATSAWRKEAEKLGLTKAECDRMASAFEHRDLEAATSEKWN
jgi:serine/threonine-protein kinase HipA